jgi:hypothetical protein
MMWQCAELIHIIWREENRMEMKKFDSRHLIPCSSFNLLDVD